MWRQPVLVGSRCAEAAAGCVAAVGTAALRRCGELAAAGRAGTVGPAARRHCTEAAALCRKVTNAAACCVVAVCATARLYTLHLGASASGRPPRGIRHGSSVMLCAEAAAGRTVALSARQRGERTVALHVEPLSKQLRCASSHRANSCAARRVSGCEEAMPVEPARGDSCAASRASKRTAALPVRSAAAKRRCACQRRASEQLWCPSSRRANSSAARRASERRATLHIEL